MEAKGNYIAEWFGYRVYPVVASTPGSLADQESGTCPLISGVTGRATQCIKPSKSRGVCTISSSSNGPRQDWIVCPFRALDERLLDNAARRLFALSQDGDLQLVPATVLADDSILDGFRRSVASGEPCLVYFQNKLGGEISISATDRSPEFSFDATMVQVLPSLTNGGALRLGKYGIFEVQTMDFHGSYAKAVDNLSMALHLHANEFASSVHDHPQWLSERVEGPNIANVFKRTFYQMMFKFQIGAHDTSAGCVFALPKAVWDSWQRHLGRPELQEQADGTYRLLGTDTESPTTPPAWIYVFDIEPSVHENPNSITLWRVIGTTAKALSSYALDVAPQAALAAGGSVDRLLDSVRARLRPYLPELE